MNNEISSKLPAGSVFMDNTTLHEASLKGLWPALIQIGYSSLAQLVEAIALHERIYVAGDLLQWDMEASAIADQLHEIVFPLPLEESQMKAILSKTEVLLSRSITPTLRASPLWAMVATAVTDSDEQEPDIIYIWNNISRFSDLLRTFHGKVTIKQSWNDYKEARVARTLLYYFLSRNFNIPYVPNAARAPLLLQIARILGPSLKDPTNYAMKVIHEIRQHYAGILTDAFGIPAIRLDVPVFLGLAIERRANTVEEVIKNAIQIRNLKHVRRFREWLSELTENFISENVEKVLRALHDLESVKKHLFQSSKTRKSLSISIGIPPSVSLNINGIIGQKTLLWFLRDLIEQSLQLKAWELDIGRVLSSIIKAKA